MTKTTKSLLAIGLTIALTLFILICLQWPWVFVATILVWLVLLALKGFLFIVASIVRIFVDWLNE